MDRRKSHDLFNRFKELFSSKPVIVRSPARINLIGEHTDYNDGFVLPAAIDKEINFYMALNSRSSCRLISFDMRQEYSFELNNLARSPVGWANYPMGVVDQLQKQGYRVPGFDCVFGGDIPMGAGLSSSAALECGIAYGISTLCDYDISKVEIAKLCQAAEADFVGLQCGLMDQYANMLGEENHFLQLDCRAQKHISVEVDFGEYGLWLLNSNVKHELGNTEYNTRREECMTGVKQIKKHFPGVNSLRDCETDMLEVIDDHIIFQRCEYVLQENTRVQQVSNDLIIKDLQSVGEKLYSGHEGLSKKYQVSCPEMDLLVDLSRPESAVLGARMMGGGFGGCTINLIERNEAEAVISRISKEYHRRTGNEVSIYPVSLTDGTSIKSKELTI